jgi:hypothetical protein
VKIGILGGLLAAILGLGWGGNDWDADDGAPAVCPETGVCAPQRPPPDEPRVCPESGVCAPHRPPPDDPRLCPDDGPCAPHLPPPARRS